MRDVFAAWASAFTGLVKTSGKGLEGIFDWGRR